MQTQESGQRAESIALSWLEHHGYELIERNFRRRVGEIDLVVRHPDGRCIVFVEVRYRSRRDFGGALESVDRRKQGKLIRTANAWLQQHADSMTPARIDVIALSDATCETPTSERWQSCQLQWMVNAVEE